MAVQSLNLEVLYQVGNIYKLIIFLLSIIVIPFVGKFFKWILDIIDKQVAQKTETLIDDILIFSLKKIVNLFLLYVALFVARFYLNLEIVNFYKDLLNIVLILLVSRFVAKFISRLIEDVLQMNTRTKKNKAALGLIRQVSNFTIYVIGFLLILQNLEFNISAILTGLGVGGLAFALAAQDILKNLFSGVSLILDKTFNTGDRITFEGKSGRIEDLKLRSTKLRTYDGTLLTIPNSKLSENIVENVTKTPKVKIRQTFGLTYDTSSRKIKKAKEIIEKAILAEELAKSEDYTIWFDNFGASSLDVNVIYYLTVDQNAWPEKVVGKENINFKILEEFEKAKINFAFPTQTLEVINKKK